MPAPEKRRPTEPEPKGGWLGPCTTGWTDLREIDKPGHLRPTKRQRAA